MSKSFRKTMSTNFAANKNSGRYNTMMNNVHVNKVEAGTATLKDLLSITNKEVAFQKCTKKIKMIQRIYSAISKVGLCTVVVGNVQSAIVTEENKERYLESFKFLNNRPDGKHEPYRTIWIEGINQFTFKFEEGDYYVYYLVSNREMEMLKQRFVAMDKSQVTLAEVKIIQADLPPIERAWQESSIDVSKDKNKVFTYDFDRFFTKIEVTSTFYKKHQDEITKTFDGKRFSINLPELNEQVFEDKVGKINVMLKDAGESFLNGDFCELYKNSNKDYFEQFADACLGYPEFSMFLHQVFSVLGCFKYDIELSKDDYAIMRNAVYTRAAAFGVPTEDLASIAVSVAMRNPYKDKEGKIQFGAADHERVQLWKVQTLFQDEFEVLRTNQPIEEELNVIYVEEGTEIVNGQEIEFVNGVSIDGTVELDDIFTGLAYNKDGKLMYEVNVYEYEEATALALTIKKDELLINEATLTKALNSMLSKSPAYKGLAVTAILGYAEGIKAGKYGCPLFVVIG